MRGAGYDAEDARILTDHVLDAALCGYEYSGLPKLLNVVDAPEFRQPRRPVAVLRESAATAMIDGGNQTGMIAAYQAAKAAIARAEASGLALVCLANTWMTGRSAYYCEMIARAGMVALHTVASPPAVAPFGGTRPVLGTNPIAFGFPTEAEPLVIDMGTSALMATDLQLRARLGTPIPPGVALGPDGAPTTDPRAAQAGALLPFGGPEGGYKGFGLALAMDALGALTAAIRSPELVSGYLFIAFKPDLFLPVDGRTGARSAGGSRRSRPRRVSPGWRRSAFPASAATGRAPVCCARVSRSTAGSTRRWAAWRREGWITAPDGGRSESRPSSITHWSGGRGAGRVRE